MADLRDLGLSEYEAGAYRALLRTGPTTAKALSRASEVPMGRVYDVLNGLEGDGRVGSQADSRPKQYAADPSPGPRSTGSSSAGGGNWRSAAECERTAGRPADEPGAAEPPEEAFWTAAGIDPGAGGGRLADELAAALDRGVSVRPAVAGRARRAAGFLTRRRPPGGPRVAPRPDRPRRPDVRPDRRGRGPCRRPAPAGGRRAVRADRPEGRRVRGRRRPGVRRAVGGRGAGRDRRRPG